MERENSPDEKRESPSQDTIFHLKPSKRDIESLEDFEDITKDFSSMKDITTQFLQNESDGRKKQSYESLSRSDDHFDLNQKVNLDPSSNLTQNFKDSESNEGEKRYKDSDLSTESLTSEVKESLENLKPHLDNPFHDFMHFEQTDSRNNKIKNNDAKDLEVEENLENLDNEIVLDDNKLVDVPSTDEVSSGSDDLSFIPKMGESSPLLHSGLDVDVTNKPVSECKSNDGTDMFFSSPPPKYISEPVLIRERESEIVQGDGFHVKESDDGDISESEEFIPEPIPKDYPEIGAIEGKQFLEAMGLGKLNFKIVSMFDAWTVAN